MKGERDKIEEVIILQLGIKIIALKKNPNQSKYKPQISAVDK